MFSISTVSLWNTGPMVLAYQELDEFRWIVWC